jgi:hypothetical protein
MLLGATAEQFSTGPFQLRLHLAVGGEVQAPEALDERR